MKFAVWLGLFSLIGVSASAVQAQVIYDPALEIVDESLSAHHFDIRYQPREGHIGEPYLMDIAIRAPRRGHEIPEFNKRSSQGLTVDCKPFATFASIREIEFIDVENVPPGIQIRTDAKALRARGGEVVGLRFVGRPIERGRFELIFKLKARAVAFGVTGPTSYCEVRGATIFVD